MGNMVSLAVVRLALTPRHGGQIVEEVVTLQPFGGRSRFRWSCGWVVEVCSDGAWVTRLGELAGFHVPLELISRAGDEWPDSFSIATSARNETAAFRDRTETALLTAASVDAAFDAMFAD